jgi:hypothetical protein
MENTQENTQQPSQKNPSESTQNQAQPKVESTQQNVVQPNASVKKRALRIGIVVNASNLEDIKYYNEQLKMINKLYPNKVMLVLLGYKPEEDTLNALDGLDFEYVRPVSIIHYFKELKARTIDLIFIPLIKSLYNATSESYKKYLEAGIHNIPVIAPNIYPYNKVIRDKQNGFIYDKREDFIPYLKDLLLNHLGLLKLCGIHANEDVLTNFNYSKKNIDIISHVFNLDGEDDNDDDMDIENQNQDTYGKPQTPQ